MNTKDAAHGDSNVVFGAMNKNDATSITVYDMSYTPNGGGAPAPAAQPAAVQAQPSAPAPSGAIDWNALAAQMVANYEATGSWFI